MSVITKNLGMNSKIEQVPVFVLINRQRGFMKFYCFHDKFNRIYGGDERPSSEEIVRAKPFTSINSFPYGCSFTSHEGKIFVVGGSEISMHLEDELRRESRRRWKKSQTFPSEDIIKIMERDPLFLLPPLPPQNRNLYPPSKRVVTFNIQKFIEDQRLDSTPTPTYWDPISLMNQPRRQCHLLICDGSLYAIGGTQRSLTSEIHLIEVFSVNQWLPVQIIPPMEDLRVNFVSCVVDNSIIIATERGIFITLSTGTIRHSLVQREVLFPPDYRSDFLYKWFGGPGITCDVEGAPPMVLWLDVGSGCIRGLIFYSMDTFFINIVKEGLLVLDDDEDATNIDYSQLIGLGNGKLAMIYSGMERHGEYDVQDVCSSLVDYHFVTFEIILGSYLEDPHHAMKTRIISDRKCYAPRHMKLQTAFVMNVCVPDDTPLPIEKAFCSIEETGFGLQTILQIEEQEKDATSSKGKGKAVLEPTQEERRLPQTRKRHN